MASGDSGLWNLLREKFQILRAEGRNEEARELYDRLLAVAERSLSVGSPNHLETLVLGARFLQETGQGPAALNLYVRALEAVESSENPSPAAQSAICDAIRTLSEELEDEEMALHYFRRAADLALEAADAEPTPARIREAAIHNNNLGLAEKRRGNIPEATSRYSTAIGLLERIEGEAALLADVLNNWGVLLFESGELASAADMHRRALALRESCPAASTADIAQSYINLAVVSHSLGELNEAERLYQRALNLIDTDSFANPEGLESLIFNYTTLLRATERAEEAEFLEARLGRKG